MTTVCVTAGAWQMMLFHYYCALFSAVHLYLLCRCGCVECGIAVVVVMTFSRSIDGCEGFGWCSILNAAASSN